MDSENEESEEIGDPDEMGFESSAREAVEHLVETAELDEEHGVIFLLDREDHHGNPTRSEYSNLDDLAEALREAAENEWINYVPFDGGEPVFSPRVSGYVENALEQLGAEDFFLRFPRPLDTETIFDSEELLPEKGIGVLRVSLEAINAELIAYFAKHPEKMRELQPRKFEELVAELFRDRGYEVELTPATKDGGFDIMAVRKTEVGTGLTLIECKRYHQTRTVGVELVRGLYGVVESKKATNGVLVTTSYFTKGAKALRDDLKYRMDLADFDRLTAMLVEYRKGNRKR